MVRDLKVKPICTISKKLMGKTLEFSHFIMSALRIFNLRLPERMMLGMYICSR
jgi:hypothetical protein